MAMPVMVLARFNAAQISRFMRAAVLDNLTQDYVRTARAKGLRERVVLFIHVLRNSLIPVVTLIALGSYSRILVTVWVRRRLEVVA